MVSCRLCGSQNKQYLFKKNDFDIVRCSNCGLTFTDFDPTPTFLKDYYSKSYFENGQTKSSYDSYQKE